MVGTQRAGRLAGMVAIVTGAGSRGPGIGNGRAARGLTPYTTSKGAVNALTMAMAVDHAAQGIRVNCILPGPVFTPMVATGGLTEEQRAIRAKASPLGTEGTAWDIGWAAVYLASPEARWVTGQLLCVDGGVTLIGPSRAVGPEPHR